MSGRARRLLVLAALVFVGQRLSALFVQAYMWEQGGSLPVLAGYNAAAFATSALSFVLLGPAVKRGRPGTAYQIGLALQALFFMTVLALGSRAGDWLYALGALSGFGTGAFWAGQNMLVQLATTPADRGRYWSYVFAIFSGATLAGPLAGGWLIEGLGKGLGYPAIFGLAGVAFLLAAIGGRGLNGQGADRPYELRAGFADTAPGRIWTRVLAAHVVSGFRDGILSFLPAVLVYAATGEALAMGNFVVITSAVGLVANWATGKWLKPGRGYESMLVSGVLQALAAMVLWARTDWATLMLYTLSGALFGPLQGVPFMAITFNAVGAGERDLQVERLVAREVALVTGRVAGMLLLLGASRWIGPDRTASVSLMLVAAAALAPAFLMRRSDTAT